MEDEIKCHREYARIQLNKTKNINLRVSQADQMKLKSIAAIEGLPYQTLAASVLHKFAATYVPPSASYGHRLAEGLGEFQVNDRE